MVRPASSKVATVVEARGYSHACKRHACALAKEFGGVISFWQHPDSDSGDVTVLTTDGPEGSGNVNENEFSDFVIDLVGKAATVNVLVLSTQGGGLQTQIGQNLTSNTTGYYNSIVAPSGLSGRKWTPPLSSGDGFARRFRFRSPKGTWQGLKALWTPFVLRKSSRGGLCKRPLAEKRAGWPKPTLGRK